MMDLFVYALFFIAGLYAKAITTWLRETMAD
jgi:hypothetical protein